MQKRNVHLDFIKAVAIIFVIAIHTLAGALDDYDMTSKSFAMLVFYRSIVAAAVPLFFMCSGALLFDKSKVITKEDILKKYIPRMIIALFFWASIYEIIQVAYRYHLSNNILEKSSIILAIQNMIYFNHNYQLYFIYIMVVFYLFTPIVKFFINNSDDSYIRYFLIIWFVLGIVLPTFAGFESMAKFSNLTQYIMMRMGYAAIGYGILGYYISQNTKKTSVYVCSFVLGLVLAFILTLKLCVFTNSINITFWGGMSLTVCMMAYGFFGAVLSTDFSFYSSNFIKKISNASFAIFLVHDIFLKILFFMNIRVSDFKYTMGVPIVIAIVFVCSYLLYFLLSKIKISKKII